MMQIKWICPTAPTQPISIFGGFPSTACKFDCFVGSYWGDQPLANMVNIL